MLSNPTLNAIKIGVGTYGRVEQHLSSVTSPDTDGKGVGWVLLRLGSFGSNSRLDEVGRVNAYAAEARVLRYWRRGLGLHPHLDKGQMGFSRMNVYGHEDWVNTSGWTETVNADEICEVSAWTLVQRSPGYEEDVDKDFYSRELIYRESLSLDKNGLEHYLTPSSIVKKHEYGQSVNRIRPVDVGESNEQRFWKHVERGEDDECWSWLGTLSQNGYAIYLWDGKGVQCHRIIRYFMGLEEYQAKLAYNRCGRRDCINPQHWGPKEERTFKCLTPHCENICSTKTKSTLCAKCQSRKRRGQLL